MPALEFYFMDASAPCRAVYMILEYLGIEYVPKVINLINKEHRTDEYKKISPRQKVPAIVDGGLRLAESRAVASYLVSRYGSDAQKSALYPDDVVKQAKINQHLYIGDAVFDQIMGYVNVGGIVLSTEVQGDYKEALKGLDTIESFLEQNEYTVTDHLTLADFFYYVAIHILDLTDFDFSKYPKVSQWRTKIEALECYEKTCGTPVRNLKPLYQDTLAKRLKSKA